jgi:hypothetical protein
VAVVLTVVLGMAAVGVSQMNFVRARLDRESHLHAWVHLGFFAAFGILSVLASPRPSARVLLLVFAVLIGVAIEYGEVLRYHSDMEWTDVRTDMAGLALGAVFAWLALHIPDRRY